MEESEIRKDYFLDKFVIIAPKRAKRPQKIQKIEEDNTNCYFCPDYLSSEEKIVQRVKFSGHNKWDILVIENKFPALTLDNPKAYGRQEVIIETPLHNTEINDLSLEHIVQIMNTYIERFRSLIKLEKIRYVLIFKNEGGKAGASISHAHSQVIALPIIPPELEGEFLAYTKYKVENKTCPYCDIMQFERDSERVIYEDEHLFVLSPYASQSPFGAWFIPKRHFQYMTEMTEGEKYSFAKAMKKVLGKLEDIDVSYNYFFHNSIGCEDYHMHMKLSPRPNVWAGLELGTGIIINPIPPEYAAKFFRGDIKIEESLTDDKKHLKVA